MMGKNHLIAGACALEHLYVAGVLLDRVPFGPLTAVRKLSVRYLQLDGMGPLSVETALTAGVCILAYGLGNLLPDIDTPNSMLGRFLHIPVEHRTWLHAIYCYLPLAVLGWFSTPFAWMFLGVVVHLFWDSLSACGNCWFYKLLSDYREYPNGGKIKKGHKLKLYHAGEWSETMVTVILVLLTIASFVWVRRLT